MHLYTDGACSGNPGPGGWGVVVKWTHKPAHEPIELSGGERSATNNRMELRAAIVALEYALERADRLGSPAVVHLSSDSRHVIDGATLWAERWERNGWRTANKKEVANQQLWRRLRALCRALCAATLQPVQWHWVKAHSGHTENERADALAREAMEPYKMALTVDDGESEAVLTGTVVDGEGHQ